MRLATTRIVLIGVLATGCGSDRVTIPAHPGPPTPTLAANVRPEGNFKLTTTLTSVTGPPACFWVSVPGQSIDWVMDVRRSATTLTLVYDVNNWPTDHLELLGSTDGEAFTASASSPTYFSCSGARVDYQFESRVAGRFSPDGNTFTAKETWTYRMASGEALVVSFDWLATRFR